MDTAPGQSDSWRATSNVLAGRTTAPTGKSRRRVTSCTTSPSPAAGPQPLASSTMPPAVA
jgi:hypothetical protein